MSGPTFDLVIRGGMVFDGCGGEPQQADVAVKDGRIAAVGRIDGSGAEEIDAQGRIVTPGFVDIHTHYDGQITWENSLAPSSGHGVTTVVMGNCGVGFAPCRPHQRDLLVKVMEGVEDIPELVMTAGVPWNWETFPEYLDALAARAADVDFAAQIPHSPIRIYVMGDRGAAREPATADDLARMTALVREGVEAGALGVTTSQNMGHRTVDGDLAPSVEAADEELLALAQGLADAGRGVFQMIPNGHYGGNPEGEMALLRRIVETSGRPLSFTLIEKKYQPEAPHQMLRLLEAASAEGLPIRAQVFPRPIGMLFGLDLSFHPFRFHPSFKPIADLPLAEKVAALRDPAMKARLLAEAPDHSNPLYQMLLRDTAELYPLGNPPNYEPAPGERLGVRAEREGTTPEAIAYDLLLEREGQSILMMPSSNYVHASLETVRTLITHPNTLIALGDGGAHYGLICDSSFPTFLIAYWTRDRAEGLLPLAWAIQSLTRDPAAAVGLNDRGIIRPGYKADINVIDYPSLTLHAPSVAYDLPAKGRRLTQAATGYDATVVSGVVTRRHGQPTGKLPGRLVRGAQSAAA
jgi:N-acyl-D-amino-acid deacylase